MVVLCGWAFGVVGAADLFSRDDLARSLQSARRVSSFFVGVGNFMISASGIWHLGGLEILRMRLLHGAKNFPWGKKTP